MWVPNKLFAHNEWCQDFKLKALVENISEKNFESIEELTRNTSKYEFQVYYSEMYFYHHLLYTTLHYNMDEIIKLCAIFRKYKEKMPKYDKYTKWKIYIALDLPHNYEVNLGNLNVLLTETMSRTNKKFYKIMEIGRIKSLDFGSYIKKFINGCDNFRNKKEIFDNIDYITKFINSNLEEDKKCTIL